MAIIVTKILNLELLKTNLILHRFVQADPRPSTLMSVMKDIKKDYFSCYGKVISTVKGNLANFLYPFFDNKIVPKIWSILEIYV